MRKYDDWQVTILHTCKTCDEANRIEIEEIRNFNSTVPNGYNLTRGGDGVDGYKWSKEQKDKLRGNKNSLGYKHTEEALEKIGKAQLGNKHALGGKSTKGQHWEWPEKLKRKMLGNKNAKGYGCPKGTKRPDVTKRNKENNPMKLKQN